MALTVVSSIRLRTILPQLTGQKSDFNLRLIRLSGPDSNWQMELVKQVGSVRMGVSLGQTHREEVTLNRFIICMIFLNLFPSCKNKDCLSEVLVGETSVEEVKKMFGEPREVTVIPVMGEIVEKDSMWTQKLVYEGFSIYIGVDGTVHSIERK